MDKYLADLYSSYLIASSGKEGLDFIQITTSYKKRWKVEEHHRSIKSNLNYAKSPAYKMTTQQNHCIMLGLSQLYFYSKEYSVYVCMT